MVTRNGADRMLPTLLTILLFSTLLLADAQLLHPIDMITLRSIKSSMHDLPGGTFFSTWVFALRVNPCISFSGVQCTQYGSFNRISSLVLGPSSAGTPGLGGTVPSSIGSLAYLESLTIQSGALRGSIPESFGSLQNLKTFSLSPNYITGWIPSTFSNLRSLETLQIRKNNLEGPIPGSLGMLGNLRVLVLSENRFYGSIGSLKGTSLVHFDVRNNDLSGDLPELPVSVEYVSVTKNRFSGSVYGLLEGMNGLSYLDLSYNQFGGGIPSSFFEYPLSFLLLNHNQFRGAVSVPGYVSIPVVDLSHNHLQGSISPYLAGTQSLFLNNNLFVGTIPQDFASKMQEATLQSLYLQHNYLTDSGALGAASLPPSVAVCLQYNCMVPPPQSLCPPNVDMPASRPEYQCQKGSNGSPGD